jgi:hypothetical protein
MSESVLCENTLAQYGEHARNKNGRLLTPKILLQGRINRIPGPYLGPLQQSQVE